MNTKEEPVPKKVIKPVFLFLKSKHGLSQNHFLVVKEVVAVQDGGSRMEGLPKA